MVNIFFIKAFDCIRAFIFWITYLSFSITHYASCFVYNQAQLYPHKFRKICLLFKFPVPKYYYFFKSRLRFSLNCTFSFGHCVVCSSSIYGVSSNSSSTQAYVTLAEFGFIAPSTFKLLAFESFDIERT